MTYAGTAEVHFNLGCSNRLDEESKWKVLAQPQSIYVTSNGLSKTGVSVLYSQNEAKSHVLSIPLRKSSSPQIVVEVYVYSLAHIWLLVVELQ